MLSLGNQKITDLQLGSKRIHKAYLGDILVWQLKSEYEQKWNELGGPLDDFQLKGDLTNIAQPGRIYVYTGKTTIKDDITLSADLINVAKQDSTIYKYADQSANGDSVTMSADLINVTIEDLNL